MRRTLAVIATAAVAASTIVIAAPAQAANTISGGGASFPYVFLSQCLSDFNASGGNKAEMLFFLLLVLTSGRTTEIDESGAIKDKNPDFGRLRSYLIPELEEQLGNYQYNPTKGITDKKLEQDDVIALGMALWYLEKKHNKRKVQTLAFNPLAPTIDKVFPGKDMNSIRMRTIEVKERQIM